MGSFLYKAVDGTIVFLCLPFYAVAIPLLYLIEWFEQRRPVRLGLEVVHWPACDVRTDYLVVDVSRVSDGLVGIRQRTWGMFGDLPSQIEAPSQREEPSNLEALPHAEAIEFIPIARFWVPEPFSVRGRQDDQDLADLVDRKR
jgi:hypothetical protein